jgi:hypothetical protein
LRAAWYFRSLLLTGISIKFSEIIFTKVNRIDILSEGGRARSVWPYSPYILEQKVSITFGESGTMSRMW